MTNVYLFRCDEHYVGYEFSGHAEDDIVCAALSVTAISAANAIDVLTDAEFSFEEDGDGYAKCMLGSNLDNDTRAKTDLIIAHLSVAVDGLEQSYPEHVKIHTREVLEDD